MRALRTPGIPLWVTVLTVLLGLFALLIGVSAFVSPSVALGWVPGADTLGTTWAGRNTGLGLVLLVAVLLRSPAGYVVAFAGQLMRELGDILAALPNVAGAAFTLLFVAVDLIGLVAGIRAMRRSRRPAAV